MPDKIPPSKFLRSLEPELVYDADELAMDYVQEVGLAPCWPLHSAQRAQLDVMAEGKKGMWMNTSEPLARVAYGWEVAQSVLEALCNSQATGMSREERFQDAVFTLEEQGK